MLNSSQFQMPESVFENEIVGWMISRHDKINNSKCDENEVYSDVSEIESEFWNSKFYFKIL